MIFRTGTEKNWSAFWDLLWSECDADKVIAKGKNTLPRELEQSLDKLHEILERNVRTCADSDGPFHLRSLVEPAPSAGQKRPLPQVTDLRQGAFLSNNGAALYDGSSVD